MDRGLEGPFGSERFSMDEWAIRGSVYKRPQRPFKNDSFATRGFPTLLSIEKVNQTTTLRTWHPTLASSERASDLVAEVHMAGGVDHVEEVVFPLVGVQHTGRLGLHSDPCHQCTVK